MAPPPVVVIICRACQSSFILFRQYAVMDRCPHCHEPGKDWWRYSLPWEFTRSDRRFLKGLRIAAD